MDTFKKSLIKRQFILPIVLFFSGLAGVFLYELHEERKYESLVATSWHCETLKTGFLSEAFHNYLSIFERMTLTFASRSQLNIREFVEVTDKEGKVEKLENLYFGTYLLKGNELIVSFQDVRQNLQHSDDVINRDYLEFKGAEVRYALSVNDENLYFYSNTRNEIYNMACFASS
ncbi:hypothetical protein GCE9029_03613 [Grimontia celer]|uniref:Uncharacterized protein n=1 Tax=Grimontia celer TaxID=1796497 RepID=A0A128F982_9GAMM|nr:hypothetical protein [Grimontia celer]CZF83060.1 hypothetical protein GCE9029_03613 [Grimontia celer]